MNLVDVLRSLGQPLTRTALHKAMNDISGLHPNKSLEFDEFLSVLTAALESGAVVRVPISSNLNQCFICWRLGAISIDFSRLVDQLSIPANATFPSAAAAQQTPALNKKRALVASTPNSTMKKSATASSFKSPFKSVATPKRANELAVAPVLASDPFARSVERYLVARARLTSLKERDAGDKVATRSTPCRPAENDERLEELIVTWSTACAAAFEKLLSVQMDPNTGKALKDRELGRALQIEPVHVGLTKWNDEEEDEKDTCVEDGEEEEPDVDRGEDAPLW